MAGQTSTNVSEGKAVISERIATKENEQVRDYQLDTIKGLMVLLVVFCHVMSHLYKGWSKVPETKHIYYFIYLFHIPTLVFISGYFSKRKGSYEEYVKKAVGSCLIPFLIFNILYSVPSIDKMLNFFSPRWTLWYHLSRKKWRYLYCSG